MFIKQQSPLMLSFAAQKIQKIALIMSDNVWKLFSSFSNLFPNLIKLLLIYVLTFLPCLISASNSSYAENFPLIPDGTTNTQVNQAANGVPIVNIAAPNASGLSHNRYDQMNFNQPGTILNNSIGSPNDVFQTQLGGLIMDNPNLRNSGPATVILNENTGRNITHVNGPIEVAKYKADLVFSNPYGFEVNGGGFINTDKVTMVAGSVNGNNPTPGNLTFSLGNSDSINQLIANGTLPKIVITGAGLDLSNVSSTDLVANAMNIVAPIYGGNNTVNIRTGNKEFNYTTKEVTSYDNTATPPPDAVAIDASNFAKIQAGRIFIVGNKKGFAIRWTGDMLAMREGINIDNEGNITFGNLASEIGDINVKSRQGSVNTTGVIQTKGINNDINLTANQNITNTGQILGAGNININAGQTFNNQSTALNLSNNNFTIQALNFINSGTLAASLDFNATVTNLNNSGSAVGGRNLTLTANQIINSNSVFANNKITITATDYLTNTKDIISLGIGATDGIIINAKTLNNNSQIAASKTVTINSSILNNNTANSIILALSDINLNAITIDNSNANVQAGNILKLRNLSLNTPDIASLFSATSESTSITNTNGSFFAGNSIDFDLGNSSTYNLTGILESTGFVKIKATGIINQGSVAANNYIQVVADNFTNGSLGGNNSNVKLIAGTYLDVTANNLISNYGLLSAKTNLTLTSINGNINNNAGAEIIGGTGKLTLSAKNGTVNQNSLHSIVANGDYSLDVLDFVNTGRVDVAGNLTLNVANNLINEATAMIYAGGNMELNVVNDLTNKTGAVIYSVGNLTIQKYALTNPSYNAANNKSNSVNNLSGQIISYSGNMRIDANTINNSRAINPFNALLDPYNNGTIGLYYTTALPQYWGNYNWVGAGSSCFGHECQEHFYYYYASQLANSGSIASSIQSGGTLTFNAGSLNNNASNISSVGNLTINADTLNNNSINDPGLFAVLGRFSGPDDYTEITPAYNSGYGQSNPSSIKSGGNTTINVTNNISNAATTNGTETIATQTAQIVNSINVDDLTKTGSVSLNLDSYFNGPTDNGLFTKNPNPNSPLFETRSQFLDQSQFFGSNYFYTKIGLNLTDVQTQFEQQNRRLVGDQFFQNKIISEQLSTLTKNSLLLSQSETNVNNEIKTLLDNAADEYTRLGLTTNTSLTQAQINSLQKDIIWFETQVINGATYIVPKIYLSQASRNNLANGNLATKSNVYAAGDVNLTSTTGKITNNGSIIGNNVTISSSGDILNKNFSNITALNALSITSTAGSITNLSQLKASGALSLTAAKDVLNSSTVNTNDKDLLASGNSGYVNLGAGPINRAVNTISSTLFETAGISAGTLTINTGNNFTNQAANINTTGNTSITAGNDATFTTLQLRNKTEESWGHTSDGGSKITDTTTNVGSNVNIGGNFDVISTGLSSTATTASINIIGSNITATGNGSLKSDFGNVNIANAVDSKMTLDTASKKGATSSRNDSVYDYKETAVESKLNFGGKLDVSAELGTMNLIGSTLKTGGDLNIGSFTVAQNPDGSYKTNADGTFQTVDGGSVLGVNIKAAELRSEHSETHTKSKLSLGDTLQLAYNPIEQAKLAWKINKFLATPSWRKSTLTLDNGPKFEKTSAKSGTRTITQHSATLDVGGNMMVNSKGDVNIAASNVKVTGNALLNVDGNVNVTSVAEKTSSNNKTEEIDIGTMKITNDMSHASASAGVTGSGSRFEDSLTTSTQKSSNINIGGSLLTNVTNNLAATNSGNLTLTASNLTVGGDSIIKTAGNFNLTDAKETTEYSSKLSTLEVEAGAKVGNAYVDAGYAWKAVVDAQKKAIQAVEKLKKMEKLKDEGKASSKAVELAAAQVVLSQTAVATAIIAAAAATAGAASAASSSMGTGFYGAGYLNLTSSGVKNTTETSLSKASNFIGYGDIDIASNNGLNVLGSMLASVNGNVSLAATTDIKIEAGTNTLAQKSKQETVYGGGSVGNNGVQLNIGMSQGESEYNKTSYANSQISAENGTLTLKTGNDANISGANLLAKNVTLDIGNNLNVSSKQTEEDFSSNGFGFNFGAGVGAGGNGGSVSAGMNMSSGDMHRMWTDNITTIKGTDGMVINTGTKAGSTGDLNLTGAAILSDNMTLNVKGNTNKKDLEDSYYSESMSIGVSTNVAVGGSQSTVPGTGGQPNQSPGGSTSISGSYAQNESNRTVYATIGGLNSTLTSATKDITGGDFEGSLTVDHRLLSESGRTNITKDFKELPANAGIIKDSIYKLACKSCFVSTEMKSISQDSSEKEPKLTLAQQGAIGELVAEVEEKTGKDVDGMTNKQRIKELNKLQNKNGALTEDEMKYRDSLWATADENPDWEKFREGHINQIANTIISDPNYITIKNKWGVMDDSGKQNYVEDITKKQQGIFGDDRDINVTLFSKKPDMDNNGNPISWTDGSYHAGSNTLSINNLSPDYNNFYKVVNTSAHEYGGHGYQDFTVENKSNFLKQNPQFSDMINLFELNYDPKVRAMNGGIQYNSTLNFGLYKTKPTEADAFNIGDKVQSKLK